MESQNKQIKEYLETGRRITAWEALDLFRCFRLASRIHDLKQSGVAIDSDTIISDDGKRYKEYWIAK
tara:strand:+ start:586 stop:786 length:201 start_codon:yes stop_codon:yes gene_type:complete